MVRRIHSDTTVGAVLTNSTTETVLKSFTFGAGSWRLNKQYEFRCSVRVASDNSTDTLTLRARLGNTTLTGGIIVASTAVDVVAGDTAILEGAIYPFTLGASGVAQVEGKCFGPDDLAGAVVKGAQGVQLGSLNTTVPIFLEITGQWSVAHADNQVAAYPFVVDQIVVF